MLNHFRFSAVAIFCMSITLIISSCDSGSNGNISSTNTASITDSNADLFDPTSAIGSALTAPVTAPLNDVSVNFSDIASSSGLSDYMPVGSTVHGPGTVFADLNNDGYPDIYAINNSSNTLYINQPLGNGNNRRQFQSVPGAAGAVPGANAAGAAPGDYDNDGDVDLFIAVYQGPNILYKNMLIETGTLSYQDVTNQTVPSNVNNGTTQAGLAQSFDNQGTLLENSYTASWGDVNRDGNLDLYIGTHFGQHGNGSIPGRFGMRDTLYLNQGNGTFIDVSDEYNVTGTFGPNGEIQDSVQRYSSTMGAMFADVNNDQWPDLIVTNKTIVRSPPLDTDQLYINRGNNSQGVWQGFQNVTHSLLDGANNPDYSISPMSVAVSDFDNDGDLDFTFSDDAATEPSGTTGTNELYVNQLSDTGTLGFAIDHTSVPAGFSWGTVFADFDNNGYEDLFVAGANCCTRGFNSTDWLYMNANGQFTDRTQNSNINADISTDGRANATADFDRDGWPDLLQVYQDGSPANLYHNQSAALHPSRGSVTIKLIGNPNSAFSPQGTPFSYVSNQDAIGARATLAADINGDNFVDTTGGESQIREVASGYNVMSTTSSLEVEFAMGLARSGTLTVDWPSGRRTVDTVVANQHYQLNETSGLNLLDFNQPPPPSSTGPSGASFIACSAEGQACVVPGPATVRYGANGQYFQQTINGGSIPCNNQQFGDPIRGTVKSCEYQLTSDFTFCAAELGSCAVPGPATVRYGANGQYFQQTINGGSIPCNNQQFGDPIRGTVKSCEYRLTSDFTFCAAELGSCVVPGPAIVRYGADGQYFQQTINGGSIPCNNEQFGDPIRFTVKSCEYQLTGANNTISQLVLNSPRQSSTAFDGAANRAIDGNTSGSYRLRSTTHTVVDTQQPWWSANLADSRNISQIQLWNRTDNCCSSRLKNVYVFVSNSPFSSTDISTTLDDPNVWSFFHEGEVGHSTTIPVNQRGRYIRVQLRGTGTLSLTEVIVNGSASGQ